MLQSPASNLNTTCYNHPNRPKFVPVSKYFRLLFCTVLMIGSTANFSFAPKKNTKDDIAVSAEGMSLFERLSKHLSSEPDAPKQEVIKLASAGFAKLVKSGKIQPDKPLTIIDFSLPSNKKRLWTIDTKTGEILHHTWVSHGRNSGNLMAEKFSNTESSYMSSLGFYVTAETYTGKHGYSLRLDGLEKDFNDKARKRAIVIHGAQYANPSIIKSTGRLGRSLGCPALPMNEYKGIIDTIKEKTCLFIYADDPVYKKKSRLANIQQLPS